MKIFTGSQISYLFDPVAKTITFPQLISIRLSQVLLISNVTRRVRMYYFLDVTNPNASASGNVISLPDIDTTGWSSGDDLFLEIDDGSSKLRVGSSRTVFRDNFASQVAQPDSSVWSTTNDNTDHIITRGGNSSGASYLRISLNPLVEGSQVLMSSKQLFQYPMRIGFGVSLSQRIVGQEVFVGHAADNGAGSIDASLTSVVADLAMPATVSVTTNVATVVIANHGYNGGDRVTLFGCPDSRVNVGPVAITVVDANTFTIPITIANGSYNSSGGTIGFADPMRYASNAGGYLWETVTVGTASLVARRNGRKFRSLAQAGVTTVAVQSNVNPYTDAFNPTAQPEIDASVEEIRFRATTADSNSTPTVVTKFTAGIPDEGPDYHLVIRARNLRGMTRPVARITAIAKTGTTTATVTTDVAHGLTTADWVQINGVNDQTNFPNTSAATAVASIIDATHFTIVIGTATTNSSVGGFVARIQGGTLISSPTSATAITSISCTTAGVLALVLSVTPSVLPLPGEYWQLHGMTGAAAALEGGYKVLRATGGVLELEAPGQTTFAALLNLGGGLIKRTDVRIHFARVMDFTRLIAEITGGRGNTSDINNAVPVAIAGSVSLGASAVQSTGGTTIANSWAVQQPSGFGNVDVASAALTTTTTTATLSPGNFGHGAYTAQIAVTAVSGAGATLDVVIQESVDGGTNWEDVYHFERITATGSYTSPMMRFQKGSNAIRYVQTVAGTTPSFTRSIRRNAYNMSAPLLRRYFDRTIVPNTLNSTTPTYDVKGADTVQIVVNMGAITTTAPQFVIEGSEDGTNWYQLSAAALLSVASATVIQTVNLTICSFVRARVSTAGSGATLGYVALKAMGA